MPLPGADDPRDQAFLAVCVDYATPHIQGLRAAIAHLRAEGLPDDRDEAEEFLIRSELMTSVHAHTEALKAMGPQMTAFGQLMHRLGTEYAEAMDGAVQARQDRLHG